MSGGEGFGGHCCDRRESHEHPGRSGKDKGERRGSGGTRGGEDGVFWGERGNLRSISKYFKCIVNSNRRSERWMRE